MELLKSLAENIAIGQCGSIGRFKTNVLHLMSLTPKVLHSRNVCGNW